MITFEPTKVSCNAQIWLVMLGSTIELVPVLVKTSAIHRLINAAKSQRRVNVSRRSMFLTVAAVIGGVLVFLSILTAVDNLEPTEYVVLNPIAETSPEPNVTKHVWCYGVDAGFLFAYYAWLILMLIFAVVLSVQTRSVMSQLNESTSLAMLVYSHVAFLTIRVIFAYFRFTRSTNVRESIMANVAGMLVCLDTLSSMSIYVFPKIYASIKQPENYQEKTIRERISSLRNIDEEDDLQILLCTSNMGNAEPTIESMKAWIPPGGLYSSVTPLDDRETPMIDNFDLIVIGMQEATWKESKNTFKSTVWSTVRDTDDSHKEKLESASDVLNAMDDQNKAQLRVMIKEIIGSEYSQMVEEQRGQMRFSIWVSDRVINQIGGIKISGANCGIGNVLANKGGIVVSLNYKDTRISFLSAHLAAHEGESHYKNRCENIRTILKEAKTFGLSNKLDTALTSHHMFVLGDLNFRTKFGGDEQDQEKNVKRALKLIEEEDYAGLYNCDELEAGLKNGDLLSGFQTLPCNFPPTFKVKRTAGFEYKTQRTPSYTDRILFKSFDGLTENLKPLAYEPCVDFITSDHKPVRGAFTVTPNRTRDITNSTFDGQFKLSIEKMKCFGLPAGDADGSSDPYLQFMWDSPNIVGEDVSFTDKVRKMMKGKTSVWPTTRYISKTLNPDWGDAKMSFLVKDCFVGQMLFIAVIDYDALSQNDCLAVVALNIQELIGMAERSESISKSLLWEGKEAGEIEFSVTTSNVTTKRGVTSQTGGYDFDVF